LKSGTPISLTAITSADFDIEEETESGISGRKKHDPGLHELQPSCIYMWEEKKIGTPDTVSACRKGPMIACE
jgi:hypothetical protein